MRKGAWFDSVRHISGTNIIVDEIMPNVIRDSVYASGFRCLIKRRCGDCLKFKWLNMASSLFNMITKGPPRMEASQAMAALGQAFMGMDGIINRLQGSKDAMNLGEMLLKHDNRLTRSCTQVAWEEP